MLQQTVPTIPETTTVAGSNPHSQETQVVLQTVQIEIETGSPVIFQALHLETGHHWISWLARRVDQRIVSPTTVTRTTKLCATVTTQPYF